MRSAIGRKDDADLTPVEWQFQYFAYREQITPSAHAALKTRLERAAERDARQSDLWACLAQIYVDEYAFGFPGNDETSLDRALTAARRGVELDRANQFAMVALAQTHFFRQDLAAFRPAAERAMALNPLNTDALGILGLQIVHTADFERGTAIVRRAIECQPCRLDAFRSPLGSLPQRRVRAGPRVREPGGRPRTLLAISRNGIGLRAPRPPRRSAGCGPGSIGARSRVCGARALEHRNLALRERPYGSHTRWPAQSRALNSRKRIVRFAEAECSPKLKKKSSWSWLTFFLSTSSSIRKY